MIIGGIVGGIIVIIVIAIIIYKVVILIRRRERVHCGRHGYSPLPGVTESIVPSEGEKKIK